MNMITFYEQARGFSHLASNKPCQDYGLSYNNDGVYIAIVCDGHGSDSYVRSDKGASIAAEIAKERILEFISSPRASYLLGKKGAVTSKPLYNPLKGKNGQHINFKDLGESQKELALQNKSYVEESSKHQDIEYIFRELFAVIVSDWQTRIKDDSKSNPFNKYEKEKLGSRRLEKAYGTTLMAAVRTQNFWFAFHIGDGKLLICNNLMEWNEPVPWDCNCFLNTTTSLCDSYPIEEFRYAFDGTGAFPLAFVLGSDGIDDTFIRQDLLYKFYSQMLCVFHDYSQDEAQMHLRAHLPVLSKKGSHDDMSIAAIIDPTYLETATQYFSIISERDTLNTERDVKKMTISHLKEKISNLEKEIETQTSDYRSFCKSIWSSFLELIRKRKADQVEAEIKLKKLNEKKQQFYQLKSQLSNLESDFEVWRVKGSSDIKRLKEEAETLRQQIESESGQSFNNLTSDISLIEKDKVDDSSIITSSPLSEEENIRLDKESDEQIKEIMNKK